MHVCVNMHETKYFVFIYLFTYRLNKLVCGEKRRESRISVCVFVCEGDRGSTRRNISSGVKLRSF